MTKDQFIGKWNTFQRRYLLWFAYGLGVLEVADVCLRWAGFNVELVSISARGLAFEGMTALSFLWGSMTVHWFVTWRRRTWEGLTANVLGVLFWLVFAAYALASWFDPNPAYWPLVTQWLRYPPVAAVGGGVLAFICFPQRSRWFPGRPGAAA